MVEPEKNQRKPEDNNFQADPALPILWAWGLYIFITCYLIYTVWPLFFRFFLSHINIYLEISNTWLLSVYNSVGFVAPFFIGFIFLSSFYNSKVWVTSIRNPRKPDPPSGASARIINYLKDKPGLSLLVFFLYFILIVSLGSSAFYDAQRSNGFPIESMPLGEFIQLFDWTWLPFNLLTIGHMIVTFGLCIPFSWTIFAKFIVELCSHHFWKKKKNQCRLHL